MFTLALALALAFIMFSLGLSLTPADFGFALGRPHPLLAKMICQVVLMVITILPCLWWRRSLVPKANVSE